mmetsp:Transcript_8123/g.22653  ORF Transcript_8123/g.22653 Transcript_8123/m.22653 type:complete len:327 (-) Transcript_8123:168-1148(-)
MKDAALTVDLGHIGRMFTVGKEGVAEQGEEGVVIISVLSVRPEGHAGRGGHTLRGDPVGLSLLNEDSLLEIHGILAKGDAHHELPAGEAGGILLEGAATVHLLDAGQVGVSIEGLAHLDAKVAEHLAPLLLHVELDLGPLEGALDGSEEGRLELGEEPSLVEVGDEANLAHKCLRAELGVLHLLGEAGLLAEEHATEELVHLDPVGDGKLTSLELLHELVAEGHLLGGPAAGAALLAGPLATGLDVLVDGLLGDLYRRRLVVGRGEGGPALPAALVGFGQHRRFLLGLVDLQKVHGEKEQSGGRRAAGGALLEGALVENRAASRMQ